MTADVVNKAFVLLIELRYVGGSEDSGLLL